MPTGLALAGGPIIPPVLMFCANALAASTSKTPSTGHVETAALGCLEPAPPPHGFWGNGRPRPFKLEPEFLNPLLTSFSLWAFLLFVPGVSFRWYRMSRPQPAPDSPARMAQSQSAALSANLSARSIASLARSECVQSPRSYPPSRSC